MDDADRQGPPPRGSASPILGLVSHHERDFPQFPKLPSRACEPRMGKCFPIELHFRVTIWRTNLCRKSVSNNAFSSKKHTVSILYASTISESSLTCMIVKTMARTKQCTRRQVKLPKEPLSWPVAALIGRIQHGHLSSASGDDTEAIGRPFVGRKLLNALDEVLGFSGFAAEGGVVQSIEIEPEPASAAHGARLEDYECQRIRLKISGVNHRFGEGTVDQPNNSGPLISELASLHAIFRASEVPIKNQVKRFLNLAVDYTEATIAESCSKPHAGGKTDTKNWIVKNELLLRDQAILRLRSGAISLSEFEAELFDYQKGRGRRLQLLLNSTPTMQQSLSQERPIDSQSGRARKKRWKGKSAQKTLPATPKSYNRDQAPSSEQDRNNAILFVSVENEANPAKERMMEDAVEAMIKAVPQPLKPSKRHTAADKLSEAQRKRWVAATTGDAEDYKRAVGPSKSTASEMEGTGILLPTTTERIDRHQPGTGPSIAEPSHVPTMGSNDHSKRRKAKAHKKAAVTSNTPNGTAQVAAFMPTVQDQMTVDVTASASAIRNALQRQSIQKAPDTKTSAGTFGIDGLSLSDKDQPRVHVPHEDPTELAEQPAPHTSTRRHQHPNPAECRYDDPGRKDRPWIPYYNFDYAKAIYPETSASKHAPAQRKCHSGRQSWHYAPAQPRALPVGQSSIPLDHGFPYNPSTWRPQAAYQYSTQGLPRASSLTPSDGSWGTPRRSLSPRSRRTEPPKRPSPTAAYCNQAWEVPQRLTNPQALLVVSDLNGTLIVRTRGSSTFIQRPGLAHFLSDLLTIGTPASGKRNVTGSPDHKFMIWTSATPRTTDLVMKNLLTPSERKNTIAVWSRDRLGLTDTQYAAKVQVYKRLESIWADAKIQASHPLAESGVLWGQHNTLLIDDSVEKAAAQPYNLINIPELTAKLLKQEQAGDDVPVLAQVAAYIKEASLYRDVSCFVRTRPFTIDSGWERKRSQDVGRATNGGSVEGANSMGGE